MAARNRAARAKRLAAAAGTSPLQWTDANNLASLAEGWWLTYDSPNLKRWLGFAQGSFPDRATLHGFLIEKAWMGSPLHLKLLALLYAHNKAEFLAVMGARRANETGALVKKIILYARMAGATQGELK